MEKIGSKTSETRSPQFLGLSLTALFVFPSALLLTLFLSQKAVSAIEVTAEADKEVMMVGEVLQYIVKIEADESITINQPRPPSIDGFEFLGRTQSSQYMNTFDMSKASLKTVRQENFIFQFQATREGKFVFAGTEVVVNDKAYSTNTVGITVRGAGAGGLAQGQQPQGQAQGGGAGQNPDEESEGTDPFEKEVEDAFSQLLKQRGFGGFKSAPPQNLQQAFFIQSEVDKTEAFVNEQVTASWYIYTRYNITDIDTLKYPSLQKFWKEDIEVATRLNFEQELVNGVPYRKALLARYALFPLKAGEAVVDEYKAKCMVLTDSIFGSLGFSRPRSYTRSSHVAKIKVKELPKTGMPSDFTGAVGRFGITATIDNSKVRINEPFTYKIRFEGRGNAKRIELPPMTLPTSLEAYDTKSESRYNPNGTAYKEFELLYVPREPGKMIIPGFTFSYFDPEKAQYETQKVEEKEIEVVGVAQLAEHDSSGTLEDKQEAPAPKAKLPDPIFVPSEKGVFATYRKPIWLGLFAFAFLLLTGRAYASFSFGAGREDLLKALNKRFKKIRKLQAQSDWRNMSIESINAINFVLGRISGEGGASDSVHAALQKTPPSVRAEIESQMLKLLPGFETLAFAPEEVFKSIDKSRANSDVQELEKILIKAIKLSFIRDGEARVES